MNSTTGLREVSLSDSLDLSREDVLISGAQVLVRTLLLQRELDRRAGQNTAGFVSGYRGSPLGGFDFALWKSARTLEAADIVFQPGVNEDLAATAVWGTQQLQQLGPAHVDGVFALWYGKGPGVDRSGDPIKHGNYAGTHPLGGVLAVFGDDHPGKSSTVAHHSEQAMAANGVPVLYPSNVGEILQYGLFGYALSRYSGCWAGMKLVNESVEQTGTVHFSLDDLRIEQPDATDLLPSEGVHSTGVYSPLRQESIHLNHRLPLVQRFARANRIDRKTIGADGPLGIVTAGKAYQDVMQALSCLGVDAARAETIGLAVYKVGLIWPLEGSALREFARGRRELFFVEEKRAFVEPQAAAFLYNDPQRPRIVGKFDENGLLLVSQELSLEPIDVALAIASRLGANGLNDAMIDERARALRAYRGMLLSVMSGEPARTPYFCSGCPHNTSTKLPEGSVAMAGIGCHGMAMWAKPRTLLSTQMGGEGANWIGLHRFTKTKHLFQNLGDGTYFHSGLLAIRAAVASGANITYKILYNDAVAMTGGQPVDGPISVGEMAHQVLHEGVKRVVVVSDAPERYGAGSGLPNGIAVMHRDQLDAMQREMRDIAGCTVLIYEQTCAAEKRRRRKRGELAEPDKRLFINSAVCEGCGDCGVQSGCVSLEPKETALGRKRKIDQTSCNKDYSCVKGFCPSFVMVQGAKLRKPRRAEISELTLNSVPPPVVAAIDGADYGVMICGIGGTGVITVGAILAMAAHLEGKAVSAYDMTGLSQKNGAVYSHLRLASPDAHIASQRLGLGDASLVLAFDMIAALGDESYRTFDLSRTRLVGNDRVAQTATFVTQPDNVIDTGLLKRKVGAKVHAERIQYMDATGLAKALCGDPIGANLMLVGVAAQRGWLPVGVDAIERAIELNGTQVPFNLRAFRIGRLWVHDPLTVERTIDASTPRAEARQELDHLIEDRSALLTAYQDHQYAQRYRALVARTWGVEQRIKPGSETLTRAVAQYFAKLMAYKDEYEVARLYSAPEFMAELQAQFEGDIKLSFNLAPPLFSRKDPTTGHLLKREFGNWVLPAMRLLARLKGLRGSLFDIFGYTTERREERAMIDDYEAGIDRLLAGLRRDQLDIAVQLSELPEHIRGYGHVKEASQQRVREMRSKLLAELAEVSRLETNSAESGNYSAGPSTNVGSSA